MDEKQNFQEYLHNNYGYCRKIKCECLKCEWIGMLCKEFRSFEMSNFDDLIMNANTIRQKLIEEERFD